MADILCKCTRCRHLHMESRCVYKPRSNLSGGLTVSDTVCPRCGCKTYYDHRPQVAWCWASGLIEMGDKLPDDGPDGGGPIQIAKGPKAELEAEIGVTARHAHNGKLLVPGVPEAPNQRAAGNALGAWLFWCAKRKQQPNGITWATMFLDEGAVA